MTTNAELQQRKERVFARGFGNLLQVFAERASNAEIWDVEGRRYIDFAAGIFHAPYPIAHHGVSVQAALARLDGILAADIAPTAAR